MTASVQLPVITVNGETSAEIGDWLAVEEPLEIRLVYGPEAARITHPLAVTMRTPGHDAALAAGFLFTEGIIDSAAAIERIEQVPDTCNEEPANTIHVLLHEEVKPRLAGQDRNFYTTSSCGVCGKASIASIKTTAAAASVDAAFTVLHSLITALPGKLRQRQALFTETGGLHAAGLFSKTGDLLLLQEDVGRHNALDKLIGEGISTKGIDFSESILLLSGRASFELIQKAVMAGIPVVAAVGAPSSLAVTLAKEFGITLVGFLRNQRFNIYAAEHRIQLPVYENTH
jgi:FdhD protein